VSQPREIQISLLCNGRCIFEKEVVLSPKTAVIETISIPAETKPQELTLRVMDGDESLISFTPLVDEKPEIPNPATPALPPAEIASNEELFLNGLHLEQYRHATYAAEPYYEEALRRDPGDSRCNNAMGLLLFRRGKFAAAEPYFRRAIKRLTARNPNPYDGEPYYNLGLSLKMQGRFQEAFDAFYKAVWNAAWQGAAYFELAKLSSRAGRFEEAMELVDHALLCNGRHHKARHLKIALLRHLSLKKSALRISDRSLTLDRLEYGALWERFLLKGDCSFNRNIRRDPNTMTELALDYAQAGFFADAVTLLENATKDDPLVKYTLGWIYEQAGEESKAIAAYKDAATLPADYCFPNRLEDVLSLSAAMRHHLNDARAPYYLGNFWYAHRRYTEAIEAWEQSRTLDDQFPTVHRNLGLAYFNKLNDPQRALQSMETAFQLNPADARVLFELDQLYKKLNYSPAKRLAFLEQYPELVNQRDDLTIERVSLLNLLHRPEKAFDILSNRNFHPWEGGEGKVTGQYVASLVTMARRLIEVGEYETAVSQLECAQVYPNNLGEGKLYGAQENNIFYYLGCAYEGLEQNESAQACFA
ncbi:MAG: tetratricopeptide repeat protein, partial [Chloroflexi bacterium]|nr:tetratricopeptide repeat protein [Chloroflexota bacterium]